MPEEIKMVHSYIPSEPEMSVKLERGQKGTYAFEIKAEGTDMIEILDKIKTMERLLRKDFCPERTEVELGKNSKEKGE